MTICKIFHVVPLSGYKVFLLQVKYTLFSVCCEY